MTTAAAQRCLLESIAQLKDAPGRQIGTSPDPLAALAAGIEAAMEFALAAGEPGIARVYANLGSLVLAVREDQKEIQL